ncbi:hypothetical protein LBMAG34_2870 [Candidatus Saccharibacteria bacterium]|nr:hypothetical protein LBMAG34_2870 [Candidatus Saccharibacteria bacterium]
MIVKLRKILITNNPGVTSILVVIAVTVILTIIIGGIAALTVRELRQASNTELSNRALQTAEAGVKAMVQKLNAEPTYTKTDCTPGDFKNVVTDTNQEITCITSTSQFNGNYESYLEKDNATQVFLGQAYTSTAADTANTPRYLKLSWNESSLDKPALSKYPENGELYPVSQEYNYPAAIELTIAYWPSGGLSDTNSKVATIFVMPGRNDEGFTNKSGRTRLTTTCDPANGQYTCTTGNTATKPGFDILSALGEPLNSNYKFAVRIKPRYANTHFKLEAYNSSNVAVNLQSSKAQIDVTAKVGNLFRRVKAEKVVLPSSVENVFDSVLFSGNNISDGSSPSICKNIITKQNAGVYEQVTSSFAQSCN